MSFISSAINAVERAPLPDVVTRLGVDFMVGRARRRLARADPNEEVRFAELMRQHPIAEHTADANAQHYEVPSDFFKLVLGAQRKYSCCLYDAPDQTLDQAESNALARTVTHADLHDGQKILELGCGWGSLSLHMAQTFPNSEILCVSNSHGQRKHIEAEIAARSLKNLRVVTADMNEFRIDTQFDRIVSVEMFEHMSNWRALLERARSWLAADGRLFVHIFTHKQQPYRFDKDDRTDWIGQHFFTGGIMPSQGLIGRFPDLFTIEAEWQWNGRHYQRTALDWLANFDAHSSEIDEIFRRVYAADASLWKRRWRLFFLSTAGLFGHGEGREWGVRHYRLAPVNHG